MPSTASARTAPAAERPEQPALAVSLQRFLRGLPMITLEGQVLAFLLMSTITIILISGNLLLYLALALGLAMLTIGFAYPYLNLRRLSVRRDLPRTVFAGEPVYIELSVANLGSRYPRFSLELVDDTAATDADRAETLHVAELPAGKVARVGYYARFPRRGVYRLRYIRLASSFPFLLFSRRVQIRCSSEVIVYPRPGVLRRRVVADPRGAFTTSPQRERGGDQFHGLREYRHGEEARKIHWKSSLRRGPGSPPLVREFEVEGGDEVLIALDPRLDASPGRVHSQERAISFTVTLARWLWRRGYRVHVATCGQAPFQATLAARPGAEWRRVLTELARYVGKGERRLDELLGGLRLADRRRVALVLVTGEGGTTLDETRRLWVGAGPVKCLDVDDDGFDQLYADTQGRVRL